MPLKLGGYKGGTTILSLDSYPDINAAAQWLSALLEEVGVIKDVWTSSTNWNAGRPTWWADGSAQPPPSAQQLQTDLNNAINAGDVMAQAPLNVLQAAPVQTIPQNVQSVTNLLYELTSLRASTTALQAENAQLKSQLAAHAPVKTSFPPTQQPSSTTGYSGGAVAGAGLGGVAIGAIAGFFAGKRSRR